MRNEWSFQIIKRLASFKIMDELDAVILNESLRIQSYYTQYKILIYLCDFVDYFRMKFNIMDTKKNYNFDRVKLRQFTLNYVRTFYLMNSQTSNGVGLENDSNHKTYTRDQMFKKSPNSGVVGFPIPCINACFSANYVERLLRLCARSLNITIPDSYYNILFIHSVSIAGAYS